MQLFLQIYSQFGIISEFSIKCLWGEFYEKRCIYLIFLFGLISQLTVYLDLSPNW